MIRSMHKAHLTEEKKKNTENRALHSRVSVATSSLSGHKGQHILFILGEH